MDDLFVEIEENSNNKSRIIEINKPQKAQEELQKKNFFTESEKSITMWT